MLGLSSFLPAFSPLPRPRLPADRGVCAAQSRESHSAPGGAAAAHAPAAEAGRQAARLLAGFPAFTPAAECPPLAAPNLGMPNLATEIRHPRESPARRHGDDQIQNS